MELFLVSDKKQLSDAFQVRRVVFIEEQKVPKELEMDEHDEIATHVVGYDRDQPIAAGRFRILQGMGKLERICVLKELRGSSYGQQLISFIEQQLAEQGIEKAKLNAQTHATVFYEKLGYEVVSDEFMDAGIPHVTMVKNLSDNTV